MKDNTYTVNGFDKTDIPIYDDSGSVTGVQTVDTINITYCINGEEYTQDLMNLPFTNAPILKQALSDYVVGAKAQLSPAVSDLPQTVQDLTDKTFEA